MIRVFATVCFWLTLLCPVFCLADADGCDSDHCQPEPRNCEAMAVGAIVAEPAALAASVDQPSPERAGGGPARPVPLIPSWRLPLALRDRATPRPPSAATRQALLQIYLF